MLTKKLLFGKISATASKTTTNANETVEQIHKVFIFRKNICTIHKVETKTNDINKPTYTSFIFHLSSVLLQKYFFLTYEIPSTIPQKTTE